jgi:hypothetical protein
VPCRVIAPPQKQREPEAAALRSCGRKVEAHARARSGGQLGSLWLVVAGAVVVSGSVISFVRF